MNSLEVDTFEPVKAADPVSSFKYYFDPWRKI